MHCGFCGNPVGKDDKHCGNCGAPLSDHTNEAVRGKPIKCPSCGLETFDGQLHCPKCKESFWKSQKFLDSYLAKASTPTTTSAEAVNSNKKTELKVRGTYFKNNPKRKQLALAGLCLGLIAAAFFLINEGYANKYVKVFPLIPTGKKTVALNCDYAGKNLSVNLTLYSNIDRYYSSQYSEKQAYLKNGDVTKFVYTNPNDHSVDDLVAQIKQTAAGNNLNGDQTLELAMCFVQNIPYDQAYGANVLVNGNNPNGEQFPYETLYNDKGICTTKTYLGSAIASRLGYGTSIIQLPQAQHMALGISAPSNYGSFGSSFAYVETTAVYPLGLIPDDIDTKTGLPIAPITPLEQLKQNADPNTANINNINSISSALKISSVNSGTSYTRIVAFKQLEGQILNQIGDLIAKKANLQKSYATLAYWKSTQAQAYNNYLATPDTTQSCTYYFYIGNYCFTVANPNKDAAYNTYSNYYNDYQIAISNYNGLVDDYNGALDKINMSINQFTSYDYTE